MLKLFLRRSVALAAASVLAVSLTGMSRQAEAAPTDSATPEWVRSVVPDYAGTMVSKDTWALYSRSDTGYNLFPLKNWNTPKDRRLKLSGFPKEATGDYFKSFSFVARNAAGQAKRYPLFSGFSFYAPKADGTFEMDIAEKHSNKTSVVDLPAGNIEGYFVYKGEKGKEYVTNMVTIVNTMKPRPAGLADVVLPGDCMPAWLRGSAQQASCKVDLKFGDQLNITKDKGQLALLSPSGEGKVTGFPSELNGVEITMFYFVAVTESGYSEHFPITHAVGKYQKIKDGSLNLPSDTIMARHFNTLPGGPITGYLKLSSTDNKTYLSGPITINNQLKPAPVKPVKPAIKPAPVAPSAKEAAKDKATTPATDAKSVPAKAPAKPLLLPNTGV